MNTRCAHIAACTRFKIQNSIDFLPINDSVNEIKRKYWLQWLYYIQRENKNITAKHVIHRKGPYRKRPNSTLLNEDLEEFAWTWSQTETRVFKRNLIVNPKGPTRNEKKKLNPLGYVKMSLFKSEYEMKSVHSEKIFFQINFKRLYRSGVLYISRKRVPKQGAIHLN